MWLDKHWPVLSHDVGPTVVIKVWSAVTNKDSFITTWTEMIIWGADHRRPTFHLQIVTKPVVTQVTIRYQIEDMDIIFPLIPLSFL